MKFKLTEKQTHFVWAEEQFVAYIGAIGCIAGEETIDGVPIAEWDGGKTRTLFGEFQSTASWIKGKSNLYRVSTQSGKSVVVTLGHRFLTPLGWRRLADLTSGALIAADADQREEKFLEIPQGFQESYFSGSHPNDGLPPPAVSAFLDKLRLSHKTGGDSNALALCRLLSTGDSVSHALHQLGDGLSPSESGVSELTHDLYAHNSEKLTSLIRHLDISQLSRPSEVRGQATLSVCETDPCLLGSKRANVVPYWDIISEIKFERYGQFYDVTVPIAEHYSASGLWHHNTGKSTAMIVKALLHCQEDPGNLGVIVRKNFTDLRDSTIKDFMEYTQGIQVKYNESTKEAVLPNGSRILFRHGDELPVLKNLNLGFFGIEQAEEFGDETTWQFLKMRLRRKCTHRNGYIVGNTAGHNWIWQIFKRNGCPKNHLLLEASTAEHAHILPPDYLENLKTLPTKLYRRFVENSWDVTEGLVFDEFDGNKHLVNPFEVPQSWERGFVLDHGFRNPTAVLWYAIDHDGNIWLYDEHYKTETPISEHASAIKERGLDGGFADPSIFSKTQSRSNSRDIFSIADEYRDFGVHLSPALKEAESARIARVNEFFRAGKIKAFNTLQNFAQEITSWKWKEVTPSRANLNLPEVPDDKNNHLMDCLSYLVASRFQASVKPVAPRSIYTVPVEEDELRAIGEVA